MAFCDGKTLRALPPARDHKRVFDGDKGPNTGGMGAVCPSALSDEQRAKIESQVFQPFLKGVQADGLDYRGVIYFGLMLTPQGPQVLEFNVRFGDPETQVILPLLDSDLTEVCDAVIDRRLGDFAFKVSKDAAFGVVCASGGYPGKFETRKKISGLKEAAAQGALVFHAGTVQEGGEYYTAGGRVLNVVAKAPDFRAAREKCYRAVEQIRFDRMHYRKDIGSFLFRNA
jgi:phosphoribosylamine--glycine ligase